MSRGLLTSEIASADMQMLWCYATFFQILSLQLMKESSFEQLLVLKKNVFFTIFFFFLIPNSCIHTWVFSSVS